MDYMRFATIFSNIINISLIILIIFYISKSIKYFSTIRRIEEKLDRLLNNKK